MEDKNVYLHVNFKSLIIVWNFQDDFCSEKDQQSKLKLTGFAIWELAVTNSAVSRSLCARTDQVLVDSIFFIVGHHDVQVKLLAGSWRTSWDQHMVGPAAATDFKFCERSAASWTTNILVPESLFIWNCHHRVA